MEQTQTPTYSTTTGEIEMADIRVQVDDAFIETLQQRLGGVKATDVVREALTLLNWASEERAHGRLILSTDREGKDVARLAMPSLANIKARAVS